MEAFFCEQGKLSEGIKCELERDLKHEIKVQDKSETQHVNCESENKTSKINV